jgi:hypothetical protein
MAFSFTESDCGNMLYAPFAGTGARAARGSIIQPRPEDRTNIVNMILAVDLHKQVIKTRRAPERPDHPVTARRALACRPSRRRPAAATGER